MSDEAILTTEQIEKPAAARAPRKARALLPLHHRVYSSLIQKINDGVFPIGSRLPSEHELGASFDVCRTTIRRALLRLEDEGFVSRLQGAGTFIKRPSTPQARTTANVGGPLTRHMGVQSQAYDSQCLEFSYVPTPSFLDSAPEAFGPVVLKLARRTLIGGKPVHLCLSYVPSRLGSLIDQATLGSQPVVTVLRNLGVEPGETDLTIEAVVADGEQAQLLDVLVGGPLIRAVHVSLDLQGAPMEHDTTYSRPDRFRYRFKSDEHNGGITPVVGLK